MNNIADINVVTLHRYYIWANRMRTHFDEVLKSGYKTIESEKGIEVFLYMSYWYGGLYVVIEGWEELNLSDSKIDNLLNSSNVDLLRRYRNGVFHFQEKYYDKRFLEFMIEGENCANWVRELNKEFGRFFLEWFAKNKTRSNL
ncbi:hypothetical protein KAI19_05435 [bacterium]|nr:hypothetical protein [bacterium]